MGDHGTVGHAWGQGTRGAVAQKRGLWPPSAILILGRWEGIEAAQAMPSSAPREAGGTVRKPVVPGTVRQPRKETTVGTVAGMVASGAVLCTQGHVYTATLQTGRKTSLCLRGGKRLWVPVSDPEEDSYRVRQR